MARNFLGVLLSILIIAPLSAKTILIVGDSLSAAYRIDEESSWVRLLTARLKKDGFDYNVVNISASGDTTSAGLSKLPKALSAYNPDIVIIELGANDGLRGLPIDEMRRNLENMIIQSEKRSAKILILATYLPPNYGPAYLEQFNQVYQDLAFKYKVLLVPMFLKGVGGVKAFMQEDGLHPNEQAQEKILDNIWPVLKTLL